MRTEAGITETHRLTQAYQETICSNLHSQASRNDEFLGFYYRGWEEEIENPGVIQALRELSAERRSRDLNDSPDYVLELLLKVHQLKILETEDRLYPERDLSSVRGARALIRDIMAEDNGHLASDAKWRTIQTMVDKRYMNVKLGWLMLKDVVAERTGESPGDPSVIDFGCSLNHGLKRLAREKDFPFDQEKVSVYSSPDNYYPGLVPDPDLTGRLRTYLKMPFALASGIGIDSVNPKTFQQSLWVKANCYPSELWALERWERFEDLEKGDAGISFIQADCDSLPDLSSHLTQGGGSDIVVLSTILYQHRRKPEKLARIVNNAKRYAKNFVMVIDAAEPDKESDTGLAFSENFYSPDRPFGYNFLVLDMHDQSVGFQKLFSYENGRCIKMAPNLGHPAVASALATG
jgi:hypothetical protein